MNTSLHLNTPNWPALTQRCLSITLLWLYWPCQSTIPATKLSKLWLWDSAVLYLRSFLMAVSAVFVYIFSTDLICSVFYFEILFFSLAPLMFLAGKCRMAVKPTDGPVQSSQSEVSQCCSPAWAHQWRLWGENTHIMIRVYDFFFKKAASIRPPVYANDW